jgi:hypothetical protein
LMHCSGVAAVDLIVVLERSGRRASLDDGGRGKWYISLADCNGGVHVYAVCGYAGSW